VKPFDRVHLTEIASIPGPDTLTWIPVRRHFDIRAFGVNAYRAQAAGEDVVEDHTETSNRHEELYVVIAGHATFRVAEEEMDAPAGTLVFIRDPDVRRSAKAAEPGTTVLAIGGKPGEPYEVSAWELWFAAEPYRRSRDYAKAVEVVSEGLAEHPDHPGLLYNLACYEALAGMKDAAFEHLERSIQRDPKFRDHARSDADFESIRSDPRFDSLTEG
jgi:tetratricopeptide (TPR) repeat protein